jgi:hypothetical protein
VVALNNAGTVVLSAQNCVVGGSSPTQVGPLAEDALQSTPVNTSGGNAAATLYCSAGALSNVAMRILGYMEWSSGLTTVGIWASGPTKIQLFGPGIKRPGDVAKTLYLLTTTRTTTTSSTLSATSLSNSIAPQSAPNLVRVSISGDIGVQGAAVSAVYVLMRNSAALTQQHRSHLAGPSVSDFESTVSVVFLDAPGTTSSTTYALGYRNSDNVTTVVFPSSNGDSAQMILDEIMA